jgi:hypothetical protein
MGRVSSMVRKRAMRHCQRRKKIRQMSILRRWMSQARKRSPKMWKVWKM